MARVKRAVNAQKKRRTVLKASKGYRGQRSRLYRKAKEQQLHSLTYAYRDRRARKGEFRKLWISRINAAARANDITYNRLIQGLKAAGVEVDRKNLAEIAVSDPAAFTALVEVAKAALPEDVNAPSTGPARLPDAHRALGPGGGGGQAAPPDRERRRAARFLAEGPNLVEAALRRGLVSEVFVTEAAHGPVRRSAGRRPGAAGHRDGRKGVVGHRDSGRTGCGVRGARRPALDDVLAAAPRLVAVAVEISEPGNAGTLIRVADAMGADAVVLAGPQRRPLQRQVSTRLGGQHLLDPGVSASPMPARRCRRSRQPGCDVLATTVDGEVASTTPTCRRRRRGCSARRRTACPRKWPTWPTHRVRIPMPGSAESLNVAAAAAICLYQSARAHRGMGG